MMAATRLLSHPRCGILIFVFHATWTLLHVIPTCDARGASQTTKTIYKLDPRNPVLSNSTYAVDYPGVDLSQDVYAEWDLAYYNYHYSRYQGFLETERYWSLQADLKNRTMEVCVNLYVFNRNVSLGRFTCPMPFEPRDFNKCCGQKHAEFCCHRLEYRMDIGVAVFVSVTLAILFGGVACYCCLGRKQYTNLTTKAQY